MTRPQLRPYQRKLKDDVYAAWGSMSGPSNAMPVAATGSGKTVFFCDMLNDYQGVRGALVHRQELIGQISLTMACYGLQHRVIAPDNVVRRIVSAHINEIGASYIDPRAKCFAAGVQTFVGRPDEPWMTQCGMVVVDESHHILRENSWGRALARLPSAYGLFPTATPSRADGKGLGRHADGLADHLILAPEMRDIIDMGYLTDYRLVLAESDVNVSDVPIGADGDFNQKRLRDEHHKSKRIVGDVVRTYLAYAKDKLGVTFAVDIEEATKIAQGYRDAGVRAEVVSGKTPDDLRASIFARFRRREFLQLVSVDLIGEGFDLPAVEVVSMARHTNSFGLFVQQFGRALRLMLDPAVAARWDTFTDAERRAAIAASTKPRAIIIDHVGNILRHKGPPDATWRRGMWTLDRREKRASKESDAEPLVMCLNPNDPATGIACAQPYEKWRACCPYCGFAKAAPAVRASPEHVEGNMLLVDDAYADALRRGISAKLESPIILPASAPPAALGYQHKLRGEHKSAIAALKNAAAWWSGLCTARGLSDAEAHKRFYLKFGVDAWTMQTFDRAPALDLHGRIIAELSKHGVDGTVNAGVVLPEFN
jgi:superfamily II DNA or RNA helicase